LGEKWSFLILLAVGAVFIGLGSVSAVPMIALIVPAALLWGYGWPVFMDAFNRLATSEIRATVLSVASMCSSAGFVILSPLFGRIVDATSLSAALVGLGLFYSIGGGILMALLFKTKASYVIS
jgi:sugar phosphate permease